MMSTPHLHVVLGSHAPDFQLPQPFAYVSHDTAKPFKLVQFRDFDAMPPTVAAEYYWLFALKRTLCGMGYVPETLTIAHSDRVNLNQELGKVFAGDAYFRALDRNSLQVLDWAALTQPRAGHRWLVSQPYFFDNDATLLDHYGACHHLPDLLRFAATATDVCLTPAFVSGFLKTRFMLRSPSVGTFETAALFKILDILESITLQYAKSGWVHRSGYQESNLGFLLERLHSYLLTVHLEDAGVLNNPAVYGFPTVPAEQGSAA